MNYYKIPATINRNNILNNSFSWSPAMYKNVIIPNKKISKVSELLNENKRYTAGIEPGSFYYLDKSPKYLIRNKALKNHSFLMYEKGDAIIPLNPKVFLGPALKEGDILLSKDSNIGECAIVDPRYSEGNHTFSSGMVKLEVKDDIDKYYIFSFLKNSIFIQKLRAMAPKGSTITHANILWLDCLIPFPSQKNSCDIIAFISKLVQIIIDKEYTIAKHDKKIYELIQNELVENQKNINKAYIPPTIKHMKQVGRLDGAIYGIEYRRKIGMIEQYNRGYTTPEEDGFKVIPGPSLEIKLLKTRIDSEIYKPGFYSLILPTNISEYGTMIEIPYIGTGRQLPLLKKGDILFGEAGFQKGRSVVLLDEIEKCTTNAHGLYARREDGNTLKSIYFRCIFDWYRKQGLIDLMGVGGSGGHFSPEYFNYIKIPKFSEDKQSEIIKFYHNPKIKSNEKVKIGNFITYHKELNQQLGIWQLDNEIKKLKEKLFEIHDLIIKGEKVDIDSIYREFNIEK